MSTNSLQGKVALVQGGSRGIGAAIVKRLAAGGAAVAFTYVSSSAKAQELQSSLIASGSKALAIHADSADAQAIRAAVDSTVKAFGRLDILVNNAGVLAVGPLEDFSLEDFDRTLAINVRSVFVATQAAASYMTEGGRIINLSTSVNRLALPGYAIYAATKSSVETMTGIFSKELRGRDITVNAVGPGPTATDLFFEGKTEGQVEAMAKLPPLERLAQPEDIASVVAFLAGRDGGWINGQTIRANGGMV